MTAIPFKQVIEYPESDGQPMGETQFHVDEMIDLITALRDRYREAADVYVGGNMFLYYVKGSPRFVVCPDVFLVEGVSKRKRRIYKLWEEGQAPSLVVEITSEHTREEYLRRKKEVYEQLGVREYVLHDPFGEYLSPPLQGFRLDDGGRYRPIEPGPDGSLQSVVTGLVLVAEGPSLRLVDAATGEPLLRDEEAREKARQADVERSARQAAEDEVARLRRELARRTGPTGG